MSYEQLDTIADAYIPLLGITLLALLVRALITKEYVSLKRLSLETLLALTIVYGLMALDNTVHIWPSWSLDYSTHTALSLALVMILLGQFMKYRLIVVSLISSFIAYAALMLYQEYHTLGDIVSTAMIIMPLMLAPKLRTLPRYKDRTDV